MKITMKLNLENIIEFTLNTIFCIIITIGLIISIPFYILYLIIHNLKKYFQNL